MKELFSTSNRAKGIYLLWTAIHLTLMIISYSQGSMIIYSARNHEYIYEEVPNGSVEENDYYIDKAERSKGAIFFPFTKESYNYEDNWIADDNIPHHKKGTVTYPLFIVDSYDYSEFFVYAIAPIFLFAIYRLIFGKREKTIPPEAYRSHDVS